MLTQTRRHSYLVSLIGIRKVVLAINKMDLVDYSREGLRLGIVDEYREFARQIGLTDITPIPLSAPEGRQHDWRPASARPGTTARR